MTNREKIYAIFKNQPITLLHNVLQWLINIEPNTHVHFEGNKFFISGHEWSLSHGYLIHQSDSFIDFLYTVYLQNQ